MKRRWSNWISGGWSANRCHRRAGNCIFGQLVIHRIRFAVEWRLAHRWCQMQNLMPSLRLSNAFTIVVRLDSMPLNQHGPARILFAPDVYSCNFMLGQNFRYLCFRLRTPHSGNNGDNRSSGNRIFEENQPIEIAVTFDGNHLFVFKKRRVERQRWKFAPEAAFFGNFFQIQPRVSAFFERLGLLDDFYHWNFVCTHYCVVAKTTPPRWPLPIILMVPVTTFFIVMQQFAELPIEWHNVIVVLAVLVGGIVLYSATKQLENKIYLNDWKWTT